MSARILLSLAFAVSPLAAFQSLESTYRTAGTAVVAAFENQRQVLQRSSAVMLNRNSSIAYGVVVSADGLILTKASEVAGVSPLSVRVDTQQFRDAKILMIDEDWDVALVKVEATDLTPVVFAATSEIQQGTWVVVNGVTSRAARRAMGGIISAKSRAIAEGGGNLGIACKENVDEVVIEDLAKDGGAGVAGLKKGDVIVALDGKSVRNFEEMADILKSKRPGTMIGVTYSRKGKEQTVEVRLDPGPLTRNDMMSGMYSERRSGFPRVIQHDIIGDKTTMGGPVLDLDGVCVGMNIARVNRAATYAIPVEELQRIVERLTRAAGV